ncbi:hypothetical protein EJ06DRAFT_533596 [Trichodelitschia bisporula]|uniref:Uncharacterized protein n=1 Tax=Trichodelitschia bisporula TaxID=703511 RepID=A0A6G1HLJ7_9PEZI|nr:hypothetical protein EJ06DRAFT_533596 [Trichodelitschia bisporula]
MASLRTAALRMPSSASLVRPASFLRTPVVRRCAARQYASSSSSPAMRQASSDLPWLLAAVGVSVPGVFMILNSGDTSTKPHGHDPHDLKPEKQVPDHPKEKGAPKDSPSGTEEGAPSNKGPTNKEDTDDHKSEVDAKGHKKRIDSGYGTKVGEGVSSGEGDEMGGKKQAGNSNTDTKHSSDVSENTDKSRKGEGTVDSAKVKGTIKPDRPQV